MTVSILNKIKNDSVCPICNSPRDIPSDNNTEATIFSKNVRSIPSKITYSLLNKDPETWNELKNLQGDFFVVGTGGSRPVAELTSRVCLEKGQFFSNVLSPFDYIRIANTKRPIIIFSVSGKTKDCEAAIRVAANRNAERIIVITANPRSPFKKIMRPASDLLISNFQRIDEKGFVPAFSTIVTSFLIVSALERGIKDDNILLEKFCDIWAEAEENIKEAKKALNNNKNLESKGVMFNILGGGLAWPAAKDLEGKFVEGGISPVQLNEIKDFSHGRFMSTMKKDTIHIIFGMQDDSEIRDITKRNLSKYGTTIELSSNYETGWGALSLLCQGALLADFIATKMKIDLAKPKKIPSEGLNLYRYKNLSDGFIV